MSELWTPSDDALERDPIAVQKVATPFEPPDLEAQGIKLFDVEDDEANAVAACLVLASLDDDDDVAADEPGDADDDDQLDDPADDEDVTGI